MTFTLLPILDHMKRLYQTPRSPQRFTQYLKSLQGVDGRDLMVPIAGYNPMGKEPVLEKVEQLIALEAEALTLETLEQINKAFKPPRVVWQVCLNVADDIGGAWTHRAVTDYKSKFGFQAIFKRHFCTPYFWVSESYSQSVIIERITDYVYRTIFWQQMGQPITLQEHLAQEVFVSSRGSSCTLVDNAPDPKLGDFYVEHRDSDDYNLIFHFFYGNRASKELGYPDFGLKGKVTGYDWARAHTI